MIVPYMFVSSTFAMALGGCKTDQGLWYDVGRILIGMDRCNGVRFEILIESLVVVRNEYQI